MCAVFPNPYICSPYTNSYAPIPDSESKFFVLAVSFSKMGTMGKVKEKKTLIRDNDRKRLDFSINLSHNKHLSDKGLIQLVKLLARQSAEEDFARSINLSQIKGGSSHEKTR